MNNSALNIHLDKDNYKDLLKYLKHESHLQASRIQSDSLYMTKQKNKKIDECDIRKNILTLPSIENSSLEDISMHFHSIRKSQPSADWELIANKSQQKFIQQGLLKLELSKMSTTLRDINQNEKKYNCNQRKIPKREPLTLKKLEKQLGIKDTSERIQQQQQIIKPLQKRNKIDDTNQNKQVDEQFIFFEETLNSYSYAIPSRRESTQIGIVRDKMYVFGGMSGAGITNEMWWFDLKKQEWFTHQSENNELLLTSHSMVVWKHFLIIFGGSSYYDHKMKIRQVYSTMAFYNTLNNEFNISLESVEPRREHKATILYNKFMVITGGIDSAEKLLNDTLIYSIEIKRWTGQKILFEEGIAQHAICQGYDYKRNIETVYLFGGQTQNLQSFPLMRLLFFGPQPIGWEKIIASGIQPEGRYNHTMECVNDYILLLGGRSQSKIEYQNDIFLYHIQNNCWNKVQRQGLQTKRWSHASCINGTNILCFGGIGEFTYLPPHVYQIETDTLKIKGKIVVVKPLSTIPEEQQLNHHMIITREHVPDFKKPCNLEKFRKQRLLRDTMCTYLPLPQLKQPKMRYDILIHFVKTILKQIGYI